MKLSKEASDKIDDLKVQAMMFDMEVDWETLQLVPKRIDETPSWIKRWRERLNDQDFDPRFDIDR